LKMPGVKLALWNIGAFAFVLINLIVSNYYSAFHQWIGK
jgi:HemX protein